MPSISLQSRIAITIGLAAALLLATFAWTRQPILAEEEPTCEEELEDCTYLRHVFYDFAMEHCQNEYTTASNNCAIALLNALSEIPDEGVIPENVRSAMYTAAQEANFLCLSNATSTKNQCELLQVDHLQDGLNACDAAYSACVIIGGGDEGGDEGGDTGSTGGDEGGDTGE